MTNWKTPVGKDLSKVLNMSAIGKATQNLDWEQYPANGTVDFDSDNRRDELVNLSVQQIRSAIESAGFFPISQTENSVPPEAERHVLNLAAWQLLNSTLNLNMAIATEKGQASPFYIFYKEAMDYMKYIRAGGAVTMPSDPVEIENGIEGAWGSKPKECFFIL